jgi:membrane protease YdiL (CAAX protease family)
MARIVLFGEAALLILIAFPYLGGLGRDWGSFGLGLLALAGAAVLLGGAVRMAGDRTHAEPAVVDSYGIRRVPWQWDDFLMFWPGSFAAASLLATLLVSLTDAGTGGLDATVRTAVESFVAQVAFYGAALFNIYVLAGLRRGGTLFDLGWRRFQWWWVPVAVVAALATLYLAGLLQLVNDVISQHLFPNVTNGQCIAVQHGYGHFLVLAIVVVCVIAPISEETIFRGFVYGWMRRWGPVALAVPLSAAVFAAVHQQIVLALPLFGVGVALALVYQYSRSVWPGVMVHALFNLPGIIQILSAPSC